MANPDSNLLLINQLRAEYDQLKADFDALVANSVAVTALTGTQRKTVEDTIYPILNGYRNRKAASNTDYAAWEVGDEVMNIDNTAKRLVIGKVIAVPFNPTTDLDNLSKIDQYVDNKPKF